MSDNDTCPSLEAAPSSSSTSRNDSTHTISSEELLQGQREIFIEHEGHTYRLRVTSRGKLYLTK